jgi:1-pyrroline-5-carboxylate dehydrogenase
VESPGPSPAGGVRYAITPFNFTAIAGDLPTAPALMGNVVLWKPSPTQQLAAHFTMRLLEEAGLPLGVANLLTGNGIAVSDVVLVNPEFTGLHFTGSTATFQLLWRTIAETGRPTGPIPGSVGETGGKDFVVAYPSADPDVLGTALIRGAFKYQGQKCSAASRAYVPRSVWERMSEDFIGETESLPMGDVTDFSNFMSAVIDEKFHQTTRRDPASRIRRHGDRGGWRQRRRQSGLVHATDHPLERRSRR